jgi:2-keto-4-pentenoate hydratase/2-oxohepta-3-ene-1,7-dioic acid hydratase in catechol pathway
MRWVRYACNDQVCYGALEDDRIRPIDGTPFGDHAFTGTRVKLDEVKLLAPVIPPTLYAAGMNYQSHIKEALELLPNGVGVRAPSRPEVGYRAINAIIGPDEAIVIPRDSSGRVQHEGELVVVIGKKARHLSVEEAMGCVLGYSIGNDVSERSWQAVDRTLWRSKNSDTFKPMGPWIETEVDLDALFTRVRVNGVVQSEFKTNNMVFGIADYLSAMTQYLTLYPGDVLWMGAEAPCSDMFPGDVVEVEIEGIGVLRNRVTLEA